MLRKGGSNIAETGNSIRNESTALLIAACKSHLPIVQWLLREGGPSLAQTDRSRQDTLLNAAYGPAGLPVVQWLLAEGGAERLAQPVLDFICRHNPEKLFGADEIGQRNGEPSELAQTLLLYGEPSTGGRLSGTLIALARRLRIALPPWRQRRLQTLLDSLVFPESLVTIVAAYSEPSVAEIWSETLKLDVLEFRTRRARQEVAATAPRRSARLRQRQC